MGFEQAVWTWAAIVVFLFIANATVPFKNTYFGDLARWIRSGRVFQFIVDWEEIFKPKPTHYVNGEPQPKLIVENLSNHDIYISWAGLSNGLLTHQQTSRLLNDIKEMSETKLKRVTDFQPQAGEMILTAINSTAAGNKREFAMIMNGKFYVKVADATDTLKGYEFAKAVPTDVTIIVELEPLTMTINAEEFEKLSKTNNGVFNHLNQKLHDQKPLVTTKDWKPKDN